MKKILFISGIQIFPALSGGQLRSLNLCQTISNLDYKINIYSFTGRKADYLKIKRSESVTINNNLSEYINRNPIWGIFQFLSYKFKLPPIWLTFILNYYLPKNLKEEINNSDLIILDFPFLYPIIEKFPNKKFIINTHNAEFELYQNTILNKLVYQIEKDAFKNRVPIIFCNENDYKTFKNRLVEFYQYEIIGNGVNVNQYRLNDNQEKFDLRKKYDIASDQKVFLFTGSQYLPNIEAYKKIHKFAEDNKDFLNEKNVTILVAGTVEQNKINQKNFKVVGKVENIYDFFKLSDFGLNPINSGSGTNVKMIEFMAGQLPILTTVFGSRGLKIDKSNAIIFEELNQELFNYAIDLTEEQRIKLSTNAFNKNKELITIDSILQNFIKRNL